MALENLKSSVTGCTQKVVPTAGAGVETAKLKVISLASAAGSVPGLVRAQSMQTPQTDCRLLH